MTPQELKNSILQMAFQGKLTNHLKTDSSVESLINACAADKNKAIKEGKNKKAMFRGAVEDDRFDIPQHWCIMYISDMSLFQEGPGILAKDFRTSGIPLIRISGMQTNRVTLDGCNYLDPDIVEDRWKHFKLDAGDILISTSASMDKVCEIYDDCSGAIPYTGQIRFKMYGNISKEYFKWFVQSPEYVRQIDEQKTGAAIKHYGPSHLNKMLIPIAPLEEQYRIVAKIEELLPCIDRYEQAWNRLEDFNKRFPDDMKKSILQMAIQGKLVEQHSEEGTAEDLYQQIQEEKQQLIKTGKIKKEKPLPEIAKDEVPFDIPESWKWVRLKDIISILGDGIHGTPKFDNQGEYFFINGNNLAKGRILIKPDTKQVSKTEYEKYRKPLDERTILLSINGTIGNYAYYVNEPIILGKSACYFSLLNGMNKHYICFLLNTKWFSDYTINEATQTTIKNVSLKAMRMLPVPLPPLDEQKRIVAKLEELLPLCERLK